MIPKNRKIPSTTYMVVELMVGDGGRIAAGLVDVNGTPAVVDGKNIEGGGGCAGVEVRLAICGGEDIDGVPRTEADSELDDGLKSEVESVLVAILTVPPLFE